MQFRVPQFLDIEDKIFGPFTFKEFVYLAGGAGACFVLYKVLPLYIGFIPILAVAGFSLALTYYKPNNKPFINMLESGFKYFIGDKLYIWERRKIKVENKFSMNKPKEVEVAAEREAKLNGNKLRDLAWSLDVLDLSRHKNES